MFDKIQFITHRKFIDGNIRVMYVENDMKNIRFRDFYIMKIELSSTP